MHVIAIIARVLIIIGGINWGLVGAFDFNLVDTLFGAGSAGSRIVYVLVGIAALVALIDLLAIRKTREPVRSGTI
ncbi:MAG: DUF378 domain-containing protein [Microbacterium sp.]